MKSKSKHEGYKPFKYSRPKKGKNVKGIEDIKPKIRLIRNRNDLLTVIFMTLGIVAVIVGGNMVYNVAFPKVPVAYEFGQVILLLLVLSVGISIVVHGFHPLLLVKSSSSSRVNAQRYAKR